MSEQTLVKNYKAGDAIEPHRFVKLDSGEAVAAGEGDNVVGISDRLVSVEADERVDVVHAGISDLELGDTVNEGDLLVAGTLGVGIAWTDEDPGLIGARALEDGVSGDIIRVLVRA